MIPQTEAQIILSGNRNFLETETNRQIRMAPDTVYQSRSIKNSYEKHPKIPFDFFDDHTLAAAALLNISLVSDTELLILPLVGNLECRDKTGITWSVSPGECLRTQVTGKNSLVLQNRYEGELIRFLVIGIKHSLSDSPDGCFQFDLQRENNSWIELFPGYAQSGRRVFIGSFTGRSGISFDPSKKGNSLFLHVIEGTLEAQYRLLESGDSLVWKAAGSFETEALTGEAIAVLIESD